MILWGKGRTAWLSTVGLGAESVRQRVHPHFLKYTAFRQTIRLQEAQAVELLQHEFHVGAASLGGALVQHGAQADGKTVVFLSLIHISEPTRLRRISYAVFC